MSRDVFPYPDDREVITGYLMGVTTQLTSDMMAARGGYLSVLDNDAHVTIAWFDTAGSLIVYLPDGRVFGTVARAINEICEMLGTKVRVTREAREVLQEGKTIRTMHFFIDDNVVTPAQPVVLMDSLGMRAWRAATTVGGGP